jgi:hypothetical protein
LFNAFGTEKSCHLFSDSNYIRNRKHPSLQKINEVNKEEIEKSTMGFHLLTLKKIKNQH